MKNKVKSEDIRHRHGVHWFMVPGFMLWMPGLLYIFTFQASPTNSVAERYVPARKFFPAPQEEVTFFSSVNACETSFSRNKPLYESVNFVQYKTGHTGLSFHQELVWSNQDIKHFVWYMPGLVAFQGIAGKVSVKAIFALRTQKETEL